MGQNLWVPFLENGLERFKSKDTGTQCVTLSVPVCLDLYNSQPLSRKGTHKFRRSGVSQSEEFVTGGDPPMGATSRRAEANELIAGAWAPTFVTLKDSSFAQ